MHSTLAALAEFGGEWVIFILLLCSLLVVAVIVEKGLLLRRELIYLDRLKARVIPLFDAGKWEDARTLCRRDSGAVAALLGAGLEHQASGPEAVEDHLAAERFLRKRDLEKRLIVLGTLGNNAPFVGLFGTVLGVIKAFKDLSATEGAGPEMVMRGLSEALYATAVGLLVAIPAVVAYNYFQKSVMDLLAEGDSLCRFLAGALRRKRGA
jgi:biopolymer transport protein ExbB